MSYNQSGGLNPHLAVRISQTVRFDLSAGAFARFGQENRATDRETLAIKTCGCQNLQDDGTLYICGEENESGKLGLDESQLGDTSRLQKIFINEQVAAVACGGNHTAVVTASGKLFTFGQGDHGQLGHGSSLLQCHTPKQVSSLGNIHVKFVACGEAHTAVITKHGNLYTCGDGQHGKLGIGEEPFHNLFKLEKVTKFDAFTVQTVACGGCHTLVSAVKKSKINNSTDSETEPEKDILAASVSSTKSLQDAVVGSSGYQGGLASTLSARGAARNNHRPGNIETKLASEERIRNLQIQVNEERNRRIATEVELIEERLTLQQEREHFERERETYEQRIRDSERTVTERECRLRELQSAVSELKSPDWIIRREEVTQSKKNLGVGAWGKVSEGNFRGCQVAVKEIHDLILSSHNRRLFEREMSIASRCRHPHLLQFIGATNDDGSPLFITELLDTDLRTVLAQRELHHKEIICIALDVAKGLNYLHLHKPFPIIHRDISSSNVLLWKREDSWRAKLSDYGAANFVRQTMTENPGAQIYAAPEFQTTQQSPKADVYSFGLLLCEMCIRELPVPAQIQQQIGLVANDVLRELIEWCVVKDPKARPSISDVISLLTQQAESLPSSETTEQLVGAREKNSWRKKN